MGYDLVRGLISRSGLVAVKPSRVVIITRTEEGCELMVEGGSFIPLLMPAEDVAMRLWGELNGVENGCLNPDHVIAVTPHPKGARVLLTNGITLNVPIDPDSLANVMDSTDQRQRESLMRDATLGRVP